MIAVHTPLFRQDRIPRSLYIPLLIWLLPAALPESASAQQTRIEAAFHPPEIVAGEHADYIITLYGFRKGQLEGAVPQLPGLEISSQQQSTHMHLDLNNATLQRRYTFSMQADTPGTYTIPPFTVAIDGNSYTIPTATLKVVQYSAKTPNRDLWLDFELSAETLYVGQTALCHLNVYVDSETHVEFKGPINKHGDAFTDPSFSKINAQDTQIIRGRRYTCYRITATLTTLKAGPQPLSFEMKVLAAPPNQHRHFTDPFDFFSDSFFDRLRLQEINLKTQERIYTVNPLPQQNQPADFSGAIGQFSIKHSLSDQTTTVGNPLTLAIELTGTGNFDRIQAPQLPLDNNNWKTYTPKAHFQPTDTIGYKGSKTFEYILIPKTDTLTTVPAITFSHFNPDTATYIETQLPPLPITLKPNPDDLLPNTIAATDPSAFVPEHSSPDAPAPSHLLPILQSTDPLQSMQSLRPLFTTPLFLVGQGLPLTGLIILYILRRRQLRLQNDPTYARRVRGIRSVGHWRRQAHKAATANDGATFLKAAQRTIQESVVAHVSTVTDTAEALTLHDIETTLHGLNLEPSLIAEIRHLFQSADTLKFSPENTDPLDVQTLDQKLDPILKRIKRVFRSQKIDK